jgi:hypothetical protein
LIERLMQKKQRLKNPQMFIRKNGEHTLTKSGLAWKWASGLEPLKCLETKDKDGVPIIDYVDTDVQFAIALIDDGRTEFGYVVGGPLFTWTS